MLSAHCDAEYSCVPDLKLWVEVAFRWFMTIHAETQDSVITKNTFERETELFCCRDTWLVSAKRSHTYSSRIR